MFDSTSPLPLAGEADLAYRGVTQCHSATKPNRGEGVSMDDDAVRLRYAKQLRLGQTDAEARLWYHLRAHRFLGMKFKRQKPVGPYIVDFICLEHKLVIEVDGGQHSEDQAYDQRRSQRLAAEGLRVLRFWNDEVLRDTDAVLEQIRLVIESEAPSPLAPLPQAGEGNC